MKRLKKRTILERPPVMDQGRLGSDAACAWAFLVSQKRLKPRKLLYFRETELKAKSSRDVK